MRTVIMAAYTVAVLPIVAVGFAAALLWYPLICGFLRGLDAGQWLTNFEADSRGDGAE